MGFEINACSCGAKKINVVYNAMEEFCMSFDSEPTIETDSDSWMIDNAMIQCSDCGNELALSPEQMKEFIQWCDDNMEGSDAAGVWYNNLKIYLEN